MVGALLLISALALGPGAASDNTNVTRVVMSEAAAYHVRTTDARVRDWLRIGTAESQTFRNLVNLLGESDLIVHVQVVERLSTAGQTSFVTSTASVRYVRIEVVAGGSAKEMVALIGHELQHAVEIAQEPRIRDRQALSVFYRSMPGNSTTSTEYDSPAARLMEARVRRELWGARVESHSSESTQLAAKRPYKRGAER